jgi:hypothetical protein
MEEVDIFNQYGVSIVGDKIGILFIHHIKAMTKHEAITFAAWLVTLADPTNEYFQDILEKVQNSWAQMNKIVLL